MLFVAHESRMREPVRDSTGAVKGTVRDELAGLARRNPDKAIEEPEPPESVLYLWDWFLELDRGREYALGGMSGPTPLPLSYQAIDAWARRMATRPEPHEVQALFQIDVMYRNPPKDEDQ